MANNLRGGFRLIESGRSKMRKVSVASGYTPANSCPGIAVGEVVELVTAGTVEIVDAGAADTGLLWGVVNSVSFMGADGRRVFGGVLPAGHTFTGNANITNPLAPIIEVIIDPDAEYEACVAVGTTNALAYAGVGANMDLSATSATTVSSVYRESLRTLDGTFVAATAQWRIEDILRDPINDVTAANYRVRVSINEGSSRYLSLAGI
jgi:hypothetical protein